jgi:hypothetical protein
MKTMHRKTKNRSVLFTLFVALLFVVAMGILFPKNADKYLRTQLFLQKTFAPAVYDMVLVGDSRMYRGLDPITIEEEMPGWNILNFGYSNGGLNPLMFRAAEQKLNPDGHKVIILGITAFTLTPESLENGHYLDNRKKKREEKLEYIYFGELLNWFTPQSPESVRNLILQEEKPSNYINRYMNAGWVASDKFPPDSMEAFESYRESFLTQKVTPQIFDNVIRQIEQWSRKGYQVFAFRPPIPEPMIALADTLAGYNQSYIMEAVQKAGGTWIHVDPTTFKTYDGSHLGSQSAIDFSRYMARQIQLMVK